MYQYGRYNGYAKKNGNMKLAEMVIYRDGKDKNFSLPNHGILRVIPRKSMVQVEINNQGASLWMKRAQGRNGRVYYFGKSGRFTVYINPVSARASVIKVYMDYDYRRSTGW